ncbi:MAG: DUF1552 domain-containing protein [Myxococcales bacterium]|nr:DUF1552 domain-containing protein [Myxococcales bacterium]
MNRRGFLRGVLAGGVATVGLPWLESTARAGDGFPVRYVQWIWGNGNRPERWIPAATGPDHMLSDELMPLLDLKDRISVITGLSVLYPNNVPHWSGIGGLLTGAEVDGNDEDWFVRRKSLDQLVADGIGSSTVYRSLELGVSTANAFSWNGPAAANVAEVDPIAVYGRLFGPTFVEPGSGGIVDPRLGYRRSALDAVMADISALSDKVSASDRVRLEQHFTGVRDLELRLARLQEDPPSYDACMQPAQPVAELPDIDGRPQLQARHEAHAALVAMALACDLTRVVTVQWSEPVDNVLYPGATDGHHNQTHNEQGAQPEVNMITTQIMEGFGNFLRALDAIPEGDASLLDHALVLGCTDVSEGRTHSLDEMPVVLAGSACGALRTGEHVRYVRRNSNSLGLTVLRAMGVNQNSFGEAAFETSDGLTEIEP